MAQLRFALTLIEKKLLADYDTIYFQQTCKTNILGVKDTNI